MNQNKENVTEVTEPTTEHLAIEILKQQSDKSKAEIRGRNAGMIALTVAVIAISIGMAVINYRNDCEWRKLFSSYEFITQDGGGYNNVNSGQQGDVNNGTADNESEK